MWAVFDLIPTYALSTIIECLLALAAAVATAVWLLWKDFPEWATACRCELSLGFGTIPGQYREPWWKKQWLNVRLEVNDVAKKLKEFEEKTRLYNAREAAFGVPLTDYDALAATQKSFTSYSDLWLTAYNWMSLWKPACLDAGSSRSLAHDSPSH